MTGAAPTVTLRQDWDYQPRLGRTKGHHASRRREQDAVVDFVARRDEGSLLVVGRRGSGKTSLVIAAVNKAARGMPRGKTLVPVPVKATSMEPNGLADKKQLLVSLIRSLRREVPAGRRARSLRKGVDRLHENATATKKSRVRYDSRTLRVSLNYGMIPSYALAVILAVFGGDWLGQYWWVPAAFAMAPVIVLASRWGARERLVVSSRHDYGFADIQRDFEQVLQDCSATHKIVFILDEFDKVEPGQTVAGVMAPIKMLINQGGALYILITSPDKTADLEHRQDANYTVFSETLFVKRSLFDEMEGFIDGIVEERSEGLTDGQYADLKYYLCYRAKADFFDLHRAVCDRRARTDDRRRPVLDAALDGRERTAANLQRAIKYVYVRKAYGSLSRQQDNEDMLEIMYDLSARSENMLNETITISGRTISAGGTTEKYSQYEASAARDLFMLLADEGYVANDKDDFTIKGKLSTFKGGTHVEEERAFAGAYGRLLDAMVSIANCKSVMDGHGERFDRDAAEEQWDDLNGVVAAAARISMPDEMRRCSLRIGEPGKPSVPPDEMRQYTDQAQQALAAIRTRSVDLVAQALELYLGISTTPDETPPFSLASAANLNDPSYCAVADDPGADDEIRIAIFDAQKASTAESIRSSVTSIDGVANEAVILLAGDNIPAPLMQSFFVVDSTESIDKMTIDAMVRARNFGVYGFVLQSPPTVKQLEIVRLVIEKVRGHRLSGRAFNFELEWDTLKSWASGQARPTTEWFVGKRAKLAGSATRGGDSS